MKSFLKLLGFIFVITSFSLAGDVEDIKNQILKNNEYSKINKINSPALWQGYKDTHPHNMYTLVLMQLGLVGLFSMLSIFYFQIKLSFNSPNKFIRDLGITLPLLFLVMMLSDSYLLGHFTTLLYVFFSSFLYKDFEEN